jgi:Holliday junction resolvase
MSGASKKPTRRPSREEIVDLFRACAAKNRGEAPGKELFRKTCGITEAQVKYHFWKGGYTELAQEAGLQPNLFKQVRLDDDQIFNDYAKICLHIQSVPNVRQLRGAQRELGTRTHTVETRFGGGLEEFQQRFRQWLSTQRSELRIILNFTGWRTPKLDGDAETSSAAHGEPYFHPFLPGSLQYLDVLARGERPPFDLSEQPISTIFERRTADAFRCLGFEIAQLGQGTGRNADVLALAPRERFAVIIDAKVRSAGYVLGTEDRKFLEYAQNHGAELQRQGFEKVYFVVVGSSFKEGDLNKLTDALSSSPIRSVQLLTASALMRLVEESIRGRSKFLLSDFERQLFAHKIIDA